MEIRNDHSGGVFNFCPEFFFPGLGEDLVEDLVEDLAGAQVARESG